MSTTPRSQVGAGSNTSLMQRHLSNKLLTPTAATSSRQQALKVHGVASSPVNLKTTALTSTVKKVPIGEYNTRPKTQLKAKDKGHSQRHARVESVADKSQALPMMQDSLPHARTNSRQAVQSYKLAGLKSMGAYHQSLQTMSGSGTMQSNASTASLLIKAPSQLAFQSQQKTILSDKNASKLGLADRPKTTMLVQLQQTLSQVKFK